MRVFNWAKSILCLCLTSACIQPSHATIACPVSLIDGKVDAENIALTFRNKGKLPLRELQLQCTTLKGKGRHRSSCHQESGLFFPGNTYDLTFSYASSSASSVILSVRSALLSDGTTWNSVHDQICKPLTIARKKKS